MADPTVTHIIKGGSKVHWGTVGATSAQGVITGINEDETAQYEKIENNQGAVVGMVVYDGETTTKLDIMADPTAAKPKTGDMLSVVASGDLQPAVITKVSRARGNKSFMTYSVEAIGWKYFTGE